MTAPPAFHDELMELLPPLRRYARALTKNHDEAADLLQETVAHALGRRAQFQAGTNLRAWTHRIMRNLFIDSVRPRKPTEELDVEGIDLATPATQFDAIVHGEFLRAFDKLAPHHREALILSVVEGRPYAEIAEIYGGQMGTVKSRVCRARDTLMRMMLGEDAEAPKRRALRVTDMRSDDTAAAA